MNIETLRIFCSLVELRNFSRTSERHGISQSAVSQQLAQIETAHKCQLVNRRKRPLELTQAGEVFYVGCRELLERYDRLSSEMAALSRSSARITVAAIFSVGMHTLQPYVKRFMARHPNVHLRIDYRTADNIYESVLRGEVDIGVVAVPRRMRYVDVYPFEDEPLVLVCHPHHPLASLEQVDIHRLDGLEFVAFEKGVPTRTHIDGIFAQYHVAVRVTQEFDNIETIKRAVEINAGVSILPETTIRAELANGTLRALNFANERFYRPTGIIVRKNKTMPQAARYLIELLQKKHVRDQSDDSGRNL